MDKREIRKIDREVLEDLKGKVDIVDIAKELGLSMSKMAADRYASVCPAPGHNDHNPSFSIFSDTQSFYCFGCQIKGDVFDLIKLLKGGSFLSALRYICKKLGISIDDLEEKEEEFEWDSSDSHFTELDYEDIVLFDSMKIRDTLQIIAAECGSESDEFIDSFNEYESLCKQFYRAVSPAAKDIIIHSMRRLNDTLKENFIEDRSRR